MIFNTPMNPAQMRRFGTGGNDTPPGFGKSGAWRRRHGITRLLGTGAPGAGAGAGLIARLAQQRRMIHPNITNPHAYDNAEYTYHQPGPGEASGDNGSPVPTFPPDVNTPFDPGSTPLPPTVNGAGQGVRNLPGTPPVPPPPPAGWNSPPTQDPIGGIGGGAGSAVPPAKTPMPGMSVRNTTAGFNSPMALVPMGNGMYWDPHTNQIVNPGGAGGSGGQGFLQ